MQLGRGGRGVPGRRLIPPCRKKGTSLRALRAVRAARACGGSMAMHWTTVAPCGGQSPGLVRGLGHSCVHACAEDMSGRLSVWRAGTLTGSRTTDNTWCRVRQLMNPRGTHFSTSAAPTGRL